MQSSFHKRAAMVILRRELARQRLPGTTVRDCFPTSVMETVKKLNRIGMGLKKAGKITKFQVINRKGKPILQTGTRNQNYADYQGDPEEEETAENGEWTLVESRRKRPHPDSMLTSPNSRPIEAERTKTSQPAPTAATWATLTEQEFPELGRQPSPTSANKKPATAQKTAQSQAAQSQAAQKGAQQEKGDQPNENQPSGRPAETGGLHQPSRGSTEAARRPQQQTSRGPAEAIRGAQPGSYPASRASSRQNSRPSTPPPIRSLFDDDRSDDLRVVQKPKPQRQFQSKIAQHQQHSRNGY
jgi:hypothetical protein